jgi:hypothetical protein
LKKKGFKEESMTKVRLYALGTSTTLESNKSAAGKQAARAGGLLAGAVVARRDERTAFLLGEPGCGSDVPPRRSPVGGVPALDVSRYLPWIDRHLELLTSISGTPPPAH